MEKEQLSLIEEKNIWIMCDFLFFFALFLEDDVITVKTPAFAESVTEGDVRWEKGKISALSLKFKYFLKVFSYPPALSDNQ